MGHGENLRGLDKSWGEVKLHQPGVRFDPRRKNEKTGKNYLVPDHPARSSVSKQEWDMTGYRMPTDSTVVSTASYLGRQRSSQVEGAYFVCAPRTFICDCICLCEPTWEKMRTRWPSLFNTRSIFSRSSSLPDDFTRAVPSYRPFFVSGASWWPIYTSLASII